MATVCVYCSSSESIEAGFLALAAEVGERIGRGGHQLVSGGGRVSMMGAVASEARRHGAHTVGVIPQHLMAQEVADTDADELLVVDTMRERKAVMDAHADVFVVLPGGIGTLEEFFEVWTAGSLGMHPKPVIVLDHDGFYRPLWVFLESLIQRGFVRATAYQQLHRVSDVAGAFEVIDALQPDRPHRRAPTLDAGPEQAREPASGTDPQTRAG
ncbi:TIGR00730 family Rossman fold protein [Jatrophihabitans telluris]|uniref:Cytokinin riboside 5'-monophosphate phosphoribohydrolase n=1 Tax=Jatrophihabitans telluris TaxID=2038343 RepID=A0ABY4QXX8_9ACTN|nr:TIGR00730 family Rossman fold protein [Jatrophihabitans telluris]UQX87706.1 TIGR00730 family Rossman fold protein [Jatrophihabitans telluris]